MEYLIPIGDFKIGTLTILSFMVSNICQHSFFHLKIVSFFSKISIGYVILT